MGGRRIRLLLTWPLLVGILAVVAILMSASPAQADPFDCKSAPAPEFPGAGMLGVVDAQRPPNLDSSQYGSYGYGGLIWHTYDLGCGGAARDPGAELDTFFGNALFTGAKMLVALSGSLHQTVTRPGVLGSLDPVIGQASSAVGAALTRPWLPVGLVLLGMLLLWRAHEQNLPAVVRAAAWGVLVMTLATGLLDYPVRASHAVDHTLTSAVASVNGHMDSVDLPPRPSGSRPVDPSTRHVEVMVDRILVPTWERGEFGDPRSATAQAFGTTLLHEQSLTREEAAHYAAVERSCQSQSFQLQCFTKGLKSPDGKSEAWANTAEKVQKEDSSAYGFLTGHSHARSGAGLLALFEAFCAAMFSIAADLVLVGAMLLIRLAVIFLPALAVVGVIEQRWIKTGLSVVVAALVNAIVFSVGAGLQGIATVVLLGPTSDASGSLLWRVVLLGLITMMLWRVFKPFRRLTAMVDPRHNFFSAGSTTGSRGAAGRLTGLASRYLAARRGTHDGMEEAADDRPTPPANTERLRTDAPRAEGASMPAPAARRPNVSVPGRVPPSGQPLLRRGTATQQPQSQVLTPSATVSPRPGSNSNAAGPNHVSARAESPEHAKLPVTPATDQPPMPHETTDGGKPADAAQDRNAWNVYRPDAPDGLRPASAEADPEGRTIYRIYQPSTGKAEWIDAP